MSRGSRRRLPQTVACLAMAVAAAPTLASPIQQGSVPAPKHVASHMSLLAHMDIYPGYSDIWGYTSRTGQEYAMLGTLDGVSIVNITNRRQPYEVVFVGGPHSAWREIKVYHDVMYVVSEGGGGLQMVSLADPEHPRLVSSYTPFTTAHTISVEPENAMLYVCGANIHNGGVLMLAVNNPVDPRLVGYWDLQYAHDVYVRADQMFVSAIRVASLYIVDISTRHPGAQLGVISGYPFAATHAAWTNDAGTHVLTTDEIQGGAMRLWDITQLPATPLTGTYHAFDAENSIPHNVFVDDGDLAYLSHYTAGVRVVDVSDPTDPREVAFYDTYPAGDGGIFSGCWGVFPFYPKSPGLVVASDIQSGLWVFEVGPSVLDRGQRARMAAELRAERRDVPALASASSASAASLALHEPAPNPVVAGSPTRLELALAQPATVCMDVVDAAGRRVRQMDGEAHGAGVSLVEWDGRDASGRAAAAGVYFLRVTDGKTTQSRRVVVTR